MNGKQLKERLSTVTLESMKDGSMGELWDEMPDMVSGQDWVNEIVDCAERMKDYFLDDDEVTEDNLQENGWQFADSECEDYYKNINARVQTLSLWAYPELDEEVAEITGGHPQTLTDLNSKYLYCAMRGLWDAIARWAINQTEEEAE